MTPLQRRAEFLRAVKLQGKTMKSVLRDVVHISYNHWRACAEGARKPSREVAERIARFCGYSLLEFWGTADFNGANQFSRRRRFKD